MQKKPCRSQWRDDTATIVAITLMTLVLVAQRYRIPSNATNKIEVSRMSRVSRAPQDINFCVKPFFYLAISQTITIIIIMSQNDNMLNTPSSSHCNKTMTMQKQRIQKITHRLSTEELKSPLKAKLEARLERLGKNITGMKHKKCAGLMVAVVRGNKAFPGLTNRLARIEGKLKNNDMDGGLRAKLEQRKARVQAKLVEKQKRINARKTGFPGVNARLARIGDKLKSEQDPVRREVLEKRKALVQAKLAEKQKQQQNNEKSEDDPVRREELEKRKALVQARLVERQQNNIKHVAFRGLTARLARIESKLKSEDDPTRRDELKKSKALVQAKLAEKKRQHQQHNMHDNKQTAAFPGLSNRLARIESKLITLKVRREELVKRKALVKAKLAEKQSIANNMDLRDQQKQRLVQREQQARRNGDDKALNRIALEQVYVGHYPEAEHEYVPLFDNPNGPTILAKRAALREQALLLAQSQANKDWITIDMYQRLPQTWSLEDEIAMFGGRNIHPKRKTRAGNRKKCNSNGDSTNTNTKCGEVANATPLPAKEMEATIGCDDLETGDEQEWLLVDRDEAIPKDVKDEQSEQTKVGG